MRDKADNLKISRFRRHSSLLNPDIDVEQSLGELSLHISGCDQSMQALDRSEQLSLYYESKK